MKLELKHLAPYLPYGLKAVDDFKKERTIDWECQSYTNSIVGLNHVIHSQSVQVRFFKPILMPLSDLTKEIEVNGEKFVPKEYLQYNYIGESIGMNVATFSHRVVQKLLEWHFDIYGLIENDLAVDINTLKK